MTTLAHISRSSEQIEGLDPSIIVIGKDVIELLTSGMYVSPITVFREYVQNAADAIDEVSRHEKHRYRGLVSISIDHERRTVSIRDNGIGIAASDAAATLLAIGGSQKRGTSARGFRGVGRLSGLAYCRELEFHCTAQGENVRTIVKWNCLELRRMLRDVHAKDDLRTVITSCVKVLTEPAESDEHSFEVIMRDVARHRHDLLLNEGSIYHYLGQVAPVPFNPAFSHAPLIESKLKESGVVYKPVDVEINGSIVFRPFEDVMSVAASPHVFQIKEIEFVSFADVDGQLGAFGWVGHHQYERGIPANLGIRGLRARVGNIQVGESNLFDDVFKEARFNSWMIGEVHVLDSRLVPNGRRDDFEVNHHTYNLQAQLAAVASNVSSKCRAGSIARNAELLAITAIEDVKAAVAKKTPFDPAPLRSKLERANSRLRAIPDNKKLIDLKEDLSRGEHALRKYETISRTSLRLDKVKSLVLRTVKNKAQAQLLITKLEKLAES